MSRQLISSRSLFLTAWTLALLPHGAGGQETAIRPELKSGPIVAEAEAGGHKWTAWLDASSKAGVDIDHHDIADCAQADVMAVIVKRDNRPVFTKGYCSGQNVGWARFHVDAKGIPYIFVAWREFSTRGWNTSREFVNVYAIGKKPEVRGGFAITEPLTSDAQFEYRYRVATPPEGGLAIDVEAHNAWLDKHCCDHLPVYQKFRFSPEE